MKKISDELKLNLQHTVKTKILPHLQNCIRDDYPQVNFEIELSDNCEQLHFFYPSILTTNNDYVRDHILLEFGVRNDTQPNETHSIVPYLKNQIDQKLNVIFPNASVEVLSPMRTFWEKATLIHVECQRDRIANTPERLSRHWYDLYQLYNSQVGHEALKNRALFESVIHHKKAFYNASYCNYDDCQNHAFKLIPDANGLNGLRRDYALMNASLMFTTEPPEFDLLIKRLTELEERINGNDE